MAFREQGYLIMASTEAARALLAENVALAAVAWAPTSHCWRPPSWRSASPGSRPRAWPRAASARSGEGWFDPRASPPCSAMPPRRAASPSCTIESPASTCAAASRPFARGRRQDRVRRLVNAAGAWAGELAALAGVRLPVEPRKRFVYVIDCREAPEALHRAPLTVDPSGVWFRPEGRVFLCGKSPEENEEPPAVDLDAHRPRLLRAARCGRSWRARAGVRERQGGQRLGRLLRLQHAGPERGHRPASRRSRNLFFANGFSGHGAQQAAARRTRGRRADRARRLPDPRPDAARLRPHRREAGRCSSAT